MPKRPQPAPEYNAAALAARLRDAGFTPTPQELERLFIYLELLQKWNKVMNLAGPYAWPQMVDDLILDSFHLAPFIRSLPLPADPEAWDFGAGAGLPGIPLRILWPDGNYTMVDSREKRIMFLQNVLARLSLPNTGAQAARVEDFMRNAAPAHLLVSRAFMPWRKLLDLMAGRLTPGGVILFMALEPAPRELTENLTDAWSLLAESAYQIPAGTRYFWAVSAL